MQTKSEFRKFLRTTIKKEFCIRDIIVAKEILNFIYNYKRPIVYKYNNDTGLCYYRTPPYHNNILLYNALDSEINLKYIIHKLLKSKKYCIFIPKITDISFKIVKYRQPFVKNKFGIKEPHGTKKYNHIILDIAVVPVLGVDKNLKRIGFGKGMYDRFFETLKIKPYNIFISRKLYIAKDELCNHYDIQADCYIGLKQ